MGFQTRQTYVLLAFFLIIKIMCLKEVSLSSDQLVATNSTGQPETTNASTPASSIDSIPVKEEMTFNTNVTNQPSEQFKQNPIVNNELHIQKNNQSDHNDTESLNGRKQKSGRYFSQYQHLPPERQDFLETTHHHHHSEVHHFWPQYHYLHHNHNNNNNNYNNNYNYNKPYSYVSNEYNSQSRIPEKSPYHSSLYTTAATFPNNASTVLTSLSDLNDSKMNEINAKIMEIFHIPMEPGLHLFNATENEMFNNQSFAENNTENITHIMNRQDIYTQDYLYTVNVNDCLEKGKSFCTKVRNYPDLRHLEHIIKLQLPEVELFLSEDITLPQNITQRMNIDPYEESLCKSREKIIYPEAGETTSSNWSFILNNQNYKQGVRIEECELEGSRCNSLISLPNNYIVTCKQHYIYRSLVALTPDGKLTNDLFKMPSCCKCVLRHEDTLSVP